MRGVRRRSEAWCWSRGAGVSGEVGKSKGRGARFWESRGLGFGAWGARLFRPAEDGWGRDDEHVAECAENAARCWIAGDEGLQLGIRQEGLDVDAAIGGGVALGEVGRDEADEPGELVRRTRGCGVGRGSGRTDAGGGGWFQGRVGAVFGDDGGEEVDRAGEAGVDDFDKPGWEPDLVAALAEIGPEAADDGGEAAGQRGTRQSFCHGAISA